MRTIIVGAILALLAFVGTPVVAGEYHPFYNKEQGGVTKERIAAAIEAGGGDLFRPKAVDGLVATLIKAGLPISDRQSLAVLIRSDSVTVESCGDYIVYLKGMGRIKNSGHVDTNWRRECRVREMWLVFHNENGGQAFLSLQCGNPIIADLLPPEIITRIPENPACVPLPGAGRPSLVVFPHRRDVDAWEACNPEAWCEEDCVQWLQGAYLSDPKATREAGQVAEIVGHRSHALKGVTMMPNPAFIGGGLKGAAVLCNQGSSNYRIVHTDGAVTHGLNSI